MATNAPKPFTRTTTVNGQKVSLRFLKREYSTYKDFNMKPRLFVDFGEGVFENFENRCSRPVNELGKVMRAALKQLELGGKIGWYSRAGCSCPCSPGFIWTDAPAIDVAKDGRPRTQYDVWAAIEGMPKVANTPAAEATRRNRRAALVNDPTIPVSA